MTIPSALSLVISSTVLSTSSKYSPNKICVVADVRPLQRKSVRFDDYDDLYVYERQDDASQREELWWNKAELRALRAQERCLVSTDTTMLRYLQVATRAHQHVSSQQRPLSSRDMQALVESLACGRYRGLELLVPSTEQAERSARNHETVASIVSVYQRVRRLVSSQSGSCNSTRDFDLNASDHSATSTTSASTASSTLTGQSLPYLQRGTDSIAHMTRSHAVALTHRSQQWAQTLGWADHCAVLTG